MSKAFETRYAAADSMLDELVTIVLEKGDRYSTGNNGDNYAYAVGYLRSVMVSIAAQSPASLKRLKASLTAAKY